MRRADRRALLWIVALLLAVPAVASAHTGPLAPYRWVHPPPEVAAGNVAPLDRKAELPAEHDRLPATEVWTGDLQAVVSFADTPLTARDRESLSIAMAPRDAASLGGLPAPLSADGNAYDIALRDGDADVATLAVPGRLTLDVPHSATAVLFSPDGATWTVLTATSPAPNQVQVAFDRPGYYLAVTDHPLVGSGSSGMDASLLAGLVALPILAVGGLIVLGRRSARQRAQPIP